MRLELPATVVAGRLRAGSSWLTRHAAACDEDELRVRLGPGRPGWLGTTVAVHLGEPADVGAGVMVPFVWEATGPLGLFPRFEGKLQLAGLDPERCELSLSGHYRPPLGKMGHVLDDALLARAARAVLRSFLRRIARGLEDQPGRTASATRP